MKNLALFILIVALALVGCAPQDRTAPTSIKVPEKKKVAETPLPKEPQLSKLPLGEGLLMVRYDSPKQLHLLTVVDPANGHELAGRAPIPLGQDYSFDLSPNHKHLAIAPYDAIGSPHADKLLLINLENWSTQTIDLGLNYWTASAITFSHDGSLIALATSNTDSKIMIVDVLQGKLLRTGKAGLTVYQMQFSDDNSALMTYTIPQNSLDSGVTSGDLQVGLIDVADLSQRWQASLPGIRSGLYRVEGTTGDLHTPGNSEHVTPGVAFSPTDDILYIVNAEKDELTSVDFAAQTVETKTIQTKLSWIEQLLSIGTTTARAKILNGHEKRLLVSPDGQTLYIAGMRHEYIVKKNGEEFKMTPLGLQIVRAADAVQTTRIETESNDMSLSSDGKWLYLHTWGSTVPATDVFDTASGKLTTSIQDAYLRPTHYLDGRPVLVSDYTEGDKKTTLAIFSPNSPKPDAIWTVDEFVWWLAALP